MAMASLRCHLFNTTFNIELKITCKRLCYIFCYVCLFRFTFTSIQWTIELIQIHLTTVSIFGKPTNSALGFRTNSFCKLNPQPNNQNRSTCFSLLKYLSLKDSKDETNDASPCKTFLSINHWNGRGFWNVKSKFRLTFDLSRDKSLGTLQTNSEYHWLFPDNLYCLDLTPVLLYLIQTFLTLQTCLLKKECDIQRW